MKLRNKLILSCAALAAVATTAVSTTFAWYTSNTTVKANGVSGATQENDDATLLISKTGKVGSWGSKVNLTINPETLVPVSYDETNGYKTWVADSNSDTGTATANTHYIQFSLYFKSGSTDSLSVTLTSFDLVEETSALPAKMVLSSTGLTQSTAGSTYTCNMFRALTYVEEIGAATEVASTSTTDAAWNQDVTPSRKAYDVESFGELEDSLASGCNVHNYYNAVKNLEDTEGPKAANKTQSETLQQTGPGAGADGRTLGVTGAGSLTGMSPILKITYTIYLDGWDAYCFDACQGQSFSLAMEFQGTQED